MESGPHLTHVQLLRGLLVIVGSEHEPLSLWICIDKERWLVGRRSIVIVVKFDVCVSATYKNGDRGC